MYKNTIVPIDTAHYRKILTTRRSELEKRLIKIEDQLDDPKNPDIEERATEREGDEVLELQGNSGLLEIKSIDAALKRIKSGTYGICITCDQQISAERLEAVPHTNLCRNCV